MIPCCLAVVTKSAFNNFVTSSCASVDIITSVPSSTLGVPFGACMSEEKAIARPSAVFIIVPLPLVSSRHADTACHASVSSVQLPFGSCCDGVMVFLNSPCGYWCDVFTICCCDLVFLTSVWHPSQWVQCPAPGRSG